jgi:ADP-ribosylation factor related protein 1
MKELLVLGAEGSGKSLLIRRANEISENKFKIETSSESTIPTTGVDLMHVEVNSDIACNMREIGSAMSSRWDAYLPDCFGLIYVIDVSDFGSLPSAMVLLHEILSNKEVMSNKPILIAFNKTDCANDRAVNLSRNMMHLDRTLQEWPNMQTASGSCVTGSLALEVIKWMKITMPTVKS